jgi:Ni2+-binding GTPase involved in maturation of urease and hydrogenase
VEKIQVLILNHHFCRQKLSQKIMEEKIIKKPFTVNVEGNIGSGKSTLLEHFSTFSDVLVLQEDINMLTNFHVSFNFVRVEKLLAN